LAKRIYKRKTGIDLWLKEIAPSTELRKWFNHIPDKWPEFKKRYRGEIRSNKESLSQLKEYIQKGPVTFIYAAKDEAHNDAIVLLEELENNKNL
jgi:uncharacterized protein YeaO (DUF488 family)